MLCAFDTSVGRIAEKLGVTEQVRAALPLRPDARDPLAVAAYVRALHALLPRLRLVLLTEAARQSAEYADMPELSLQAALSARRASAPNWRGAQAGGAVAMSLLHVMPSLLRLEAWQATRRRVHRHLPTQVACTISYELNSCLRFKDVG